jgi:hypothetical protein
MKTNVKRALIIGGITVVAAGLAWLFMKGRKGNPAELPPVTTPQQEECLTFPIGRGAGYVKACEKPAVKLIQAWLNEQDWLYQTWVDGMFGADTESLLEYWTQQRTVDQALYNQIKTEMAPGYVKTTLSYI